jgi:hypothetical protein
MKMEKITKLSNGGELHKYPNGEKHWLLNGKLHRENGPALELSTGSKAWYLNDKLHREDGPAVIRWDGHKRWYLHGVQIPCTTQKEFKRLMKVKVFW